MYEMEEGMDGQTKGLQCIDTVGTTRYGQSKEKCLHVIALITKH